MEKYNLNKTKIPRIKEWFNRSNGNTNIMVITSWILMLVAGLILGRALT